jgi:hypothetical protein
MQHVLFGVTLATWLAALSALLMITGSWFYICDTLAGKTRPNLVTFSLWSIFPLIATFAAWSLEADFWPTLRTFLAGLLPLMILIAAAATPHRFWKVSHFDLLCGALSVAIMILWVVTANPRLALLLSAAADFLAALPTMIKAWKFPETETGLNYMAGALSILLVFPSIPVWNIENSAFQLALLATNVIILFGIYRKRILLGPR